MAILSGYRILWMLVMFDLPVVTAQQRKEATAFRERLLDLGFERCQLSAYLRFCAGKDVVERHVRRIREFLPEGGKVDILTFTDKQYEKIITFTARRRSKGKKRDQFTLF
jgi:CRISPR-associated protein Cas2